MSNKSSYLTEIKRVSSSDVMNTDGELWFVSTSSVSHIISQHPWAALTHPPLPHINDQIFDESLFYLNLEMQV